MDSGERERELKLGLPDRDAFARVKAALGGLCRPTVHQENAFFDSEAGALDALHIACRIRRTSTEATPDAPAYTLTVKGPPLDGDTAFQAERTELESPLEANEAEAALAEPAGARGIGALLAGLEAGLEPGERRALLDRVRAEVSPSDWRAAGRFLNHRTPVETRLPGDPGERPRLLELDETEFRSDADELVRIDYELELELGTDEDAGAVEAALRRRFEAAGVAPVDLGSKLARLRRLAAETRAS